MINKFLKGCDFLFYAFLVNYFIYYLFSKPNNVFINNSLFLFFSFLLIIFSNLIRTVRLLLLVVEKNKFFYDSFIYHLKSNIFVLMIPFKLGEFFRLIYFYKLTKNFIYSIAVFLIEKLIDALSLVITLIVIFQFIDVSFRSKIVLTFLSLLIILIFIIWYSIDSTVLYGRKIILFYGKSIKSIYYLQVLKRITESKQIVYSIISNKFNIVFILSILAWIIDFFALYLFSTSITSDNQYIDSNKIKLLLNYIENIVSHFLFLNHEFFNNIEGQFYLSNVIILSIFYFIFIFYFKLKFKKG